MAVLVACHFWREDSGACGLLPVAVTETFLAGSSIATATADDDDEGSTCAGDFVVGLVATS